MKTDLKESTYNIDKILDKRKKNGHIEYLIKWIGYTNEDNTWESRDNLIEDGAKDLLDAYDKETKKKNKIFTSKKMLLEINCCENKIDKRP